MIQVRLPDGAIKEVSKGTTPLEIATSISEGLARKRADYQGGNGDFGQTPGQSRPGGNEDDSWLVLQFSEDAYLYAGK
mgnify:CR=1 FL=1